MKKKEEDAEMWRKKLFGELFPEETD